ncbi:hypothetical protein ACFL5P_01680 [candidate division KSB1 bacterium]
MDWLTMQFYVLTFGLGLLIGSLISYFMMRKTIRKNMETIANQMNIINTQKIQKERKMKERRDNMLLLADKLKQIEDNIQKIRKQEYNSYLNSLNRLLDQTGISKIGKKG